MAALLRRFPAMSPLPEAAAPARLRRARVAVSLLFFVNGAAFANVLPRLPGIKADLELTNAALGLAIAAGPVGGIVAAALAGILIGRFGSATIALVFAALLLGALAVVGAAPAWTVLVVAFFLGGAGDATMDTAVNAHGVLVQREYGRSILHGFHGFWSLGSLAGGATGAVMAATGVPIEVHLFGVAALLACVALLASRWLLGGRDVDAAARVLEPVADRDDPGHRLASARRLVKVLAPIALAGVLGSVVEEASATWSSVYLTEVVDAPFALAALGFVGFSAAMTMGRLTNDRWIDRWGNVRVARIGAILATTGIAVVAIGGALGLLPVAVLGFALAGLGVSPIFPVMVDAAGHRPGIRAADGVATVSWLARFAFFVSPVVIGVTADAVGLRAALMLPIVAGLFAVLAAGAFATAHGAFRDVPPATPETV